MILCGCITPIPYTPDQSLGILQGFHDALVTQLCTTDDELVVARCEPDSRVRDKNTLFDFGRCQMIERYGRITGPSGVVPPQPSEETP